MRGKGKGARGGRSASLGCVVSHWRIAREGCCYRRHDKLEVGLSGLRHGSKDSNRAAGVVVGVDLRGTYRLEFVH